MNDVEDKLVLILPNIEKIFSNNQNLILIFDIRCIPLITEYHRIFSAFGGRALRSRIVVYNVYQFSY